MSRRDTARTYDPAIGLALVFGPPLGRDNATYGEIGDICNGQQTTAVLGDGKRYTVQKLWSNKTGPRRPRCCSSSRRVRRFRRSE
jgi:hypothetical protein